MPALAMSSLSAPPAPADLLALARGRTADDRKRLLLGIAALCDAVKPDDETAPVVADVFMALAGQAERDIRRILADRLQRAEWAPRALVNMLALDEIEIARPILASSPLLRDDDLLNILVQTGLDHQIEIARRPAISGRVADAIIELADPAGLTALASNRTAEISTAGLSRLVEHSRRVAALRAPLTRHPRLTPEQAEQLYQWVGEALREAIAERFSVDKPHLAHAIAEAVAIARTGRTADSRFVEHDPERDEMDRRLVAKLQKSGQLKAGFLIRSLRERRLGLFEHGLTALSGFTLAQVRAAVRASSAEALFNACVAIGMDRAAFPTALNDIRRLTGGYPGMGGESAWMRSAPTAAVAERTFHAMIPAATVQSV